MSLAELELSVRATNCLESEGITTVRDLVIRTDEELLEVRNFGETTLKEVKQKLRGARPAPGHETAGVAATLTTLCAGGVGRDDPAKLASGDHSPLTDRLPCDIVKPAANWAATPRIAWR